MKRRKTEKEKVENTWRSNIFGQRRRKKRKGKEGNYLKKEKISPTLWPTEEKKNGDRRGIAHVSHDRHDRRWCTFFKPVPLLALKTLIFCFGPFCLF